MDGIVEEVRRIAERNSLLCVLGLCNESTSFSSLV